MKLLRSTTSPRAGRGFTMIELLVVIAIISIVLGMTVAVVQVTMTADQIPTTAGQIKSAVLGGRDRAVRAAQQAAASASPRRGLRFVLDTTYQTTASSIVFVGSQDDWVQGKVDINNGANSLNQNGSNLTGWDTLLTGGVLSDGARIKIPDSSAGVWYRVKSPLTGSALTLTRNFAGTTLTAGSYRLQLGSTPLPDDNPIVFNGNVVVDLERSRLSKLTTAADDPGLLPADWYDDANSRYDQARLEILFAPTGNVAGPLASQGPIYLYLCTRADLDDPTTGTAGDRIDPANPLSGDKLILRFTPQTGAMQTFAVDLTDQYDNTTLPPNAGPPAGPPDGKADDPFALARK